MEFQANHISIHCRCFKNTIELSHIYHDRCEYKKVLK